MTITSFCREQLLTHGPLSLDDLTARALDAGVTRSKTPHTSVSGALRTEISLLDGRWVTGLWLLEGRCLTTESLPHRRTWYGEKDADLGLLGEAIPTRDPLELAGVDDLGTVSCVRVVQGQPHVSRIATPPGDTLEVSALAERLKGMTPEPRYGEWRTLALRAVAQLMVDDPSTFRTPLPPLSTWVPALVEDARRQEEESRQQQEWFEEDERRRARQVVLDDCTAIDVELAAQRARMSVREWVLTAIDGALRAQPSRAAGSDGVVISLDGRWR